MGQLKTATVRLVEAYETPDHGTGIRGVLMPNIITGHKPERVVQFVTLDELLDAARAFAQEESERTGHGWALWFNLPRGARKPPGFDARTRSVYVNLTPEPSRYA